MPEPSNNTRVVGEMRVGRWGPTITLSADASIQKDQPRGPTIESVHRDIAFANTYRIELIKYVLAIAAGLFAFTATFRPSLACVCEPDAMLWGWIALGLSMVGGMVHMAGWDHYYKSFRDHDWAERNDNGAQKGKAARKWINRWRRAGMAFQYLGFVAGVAAIGYFAYMNLNNVRKDDSSKGAVTQPQTCSCKRP